MADRAPTRGFALRLSLFFAASTWLLSRHHREIAVAWALLGISVVTLGLIAPKCLSPLHRLQVAVGTALRKAMTVTILTLVYFAIVTPMAWLARRMGHDFLNHLDSPRPLNKNQLKPDSKTDSFFIRRPEGRRKTEDYEKGW